MRGDTDNEDEFRVVFEMNSEQVFYFKSPNVHKTECTKVEKFFVIGDFDQCTKHLAVKYTFFNGTEKLGFYSKNGILRKFSPTRACEKKAETFFNIDEKNQLIRVGNKIDIKPDGLKVSEALLKLDNQLNTNDNSELWYYEKVNLNYSLVRNGIYSFILDIFLFFGSIMSVGMGIKVLNTTSKKRLRIIFSGFFKDVIATYDSKIEQIELGLLPLQQKIDKTHDSLLPLKEKIDTTYDSLLPLKEKIDTTYDMVSIPSAPPVPYESFYPTLNTNYHVEDEQEITKKRQKLKGITGKVLWKWKNLY